MSIKKWKKIGSARILAQSHGRKFLEQDFEDPHTGTQSTYAQVEGHPFASIVFALTPQQEVLAIRQFRHAANDIILELPGGCPKNSEQAPETVAREELAEETEGYVPEQVVQLGDAQWFDPAFLLTPYYPFLFTGCKKGTQPAHLDDGEYTELVKIPLAEWTAMIFSGKITDSKSIMVTFLALHHLGYQLTPPSDG